MLVAGLVVAAGVDGAGVVATGVDWVLLVVVLSAGCVGTASLGTLPN